MIEPFVQWNNLRFESVDMDGKRIDKVSCPRDELGVEVQYLVGLPGTRIRVPAEIEPAQWPRGPKPLA